MKRISIAAIAALMIAAPAMAVAYMNMDAHDAAKAAFPVGFVVMWVIFDRIKQAADKKYAERQMANFAKSPGHERFQEVRMDMAYLIENGTATLQDAYDLAITQRDCKK
jgi:hypothetical protein